MLRFVRTFGWLAVLAMGFESAFGFALLGPIGADAWQVPDFGFFNPLRADAGGPKNVGEEFRWNRPVLYYTMDETFLDYFGFDAGVAVDKAFTVFNNLTNLSYYSADLSEFPLQSTRVNQRAESLGLLDLKSETMHMVIEQLGLADPVRYIFNTHARNIPIGGKCPDNVEYLVVERNFDPGAGSTSVSQLRSSHYVNGVLYSYGIKEYCAPPPDPYAMAESLEFQVDVSGASTVLPVAATQYALWSPPALPATFTAGAFYTGLTRDDVGGLRYLLSPKNVNFESAGIDVQLLQTNSSSVLLTNENLALFAAVAKTNDPLTLAALYPGLVVNSSTYEWVKVTKSIQYIAYYTNSPYDPAGTFPYKPVTRTSNWTAYVQNWSHTFGNTFMVTNSSHGYVAVPMTTIPTNTVHSIVGVQSVAVTNLVNAYSPAGTPIIGTNVSSVTTLATNAIAGEFFINNFGTATNCGFASVNLLDGPNVATTIEVIESSTNVIAYTNTAGGTNGAASGTYALSYTKYLYHFYTNHAFVVRTVDCVGDTPALRQGIDHMEFIRRDFDSLTGRFWFPVTNEFTLMMVTNGQLMPQRVRRVLTTPDFVFRGEDLSPTAVNGILYGNAAARPTAIFNALYAPVGRSGPGTMDNPLTTFTFNTASPIFYVSNITKVAPGTNGFVLGQGQIPFVWWGSFDGSTNEPMVFPNDVSVAKIAKMQLIQVSPRYFDEGLVGTPFNTQLSTVTADPATTGWVGPFTWSFAPSSPGGLPPGLRLSSSGLISGTPALAGFYDFIIRVTDASGDTFDQSYYIKINY